MISLKQGAEAKLYSYDFYGKPCIIKERFKKKYRHDILDSSLTEQRIKAEVRANFRCRMAGILTPTIFMVNFKDSIIYMEKILSSITVREHILNIQSTDKLTANEKLHTVAEKIGKILSKLHSNNIIHGDLTTSNMLLQGDSSDPRLYVIDFGLSSFEDSAESKGADLYVIERAFLSSHPNSECLFETILSSYQNEMENKSACHEVLAKLEEVRLRGRKRTIVG
ncbi:EKC/KEOPS complex subunit TP53RK-like [Physella acuta]|uniref:EKC/KEOPS complex subunit TP53RK-like n=1 Tax=Physella acuta TaxID=109671 RepID=UPI0027DDC73A|nr:EKC/KEOPS complex subunit TP53RK-like [Physella acuta]